MSRRGVAATEGPPIRGVRIVVTRPPADWFHGLARQYAARYAEALRGEGARVLEVPLEALLDRPAADAKPALDAIARFRPDLAIGLHDAGYALLCRVHGTGAAVANAFADVLDLPTVLLWDHALLQFAPIVLGALPDRPEASRSGCLARFRAALDHPRFLHVARDSGHRETVHALGVLDRARIALEPAFVEPHFRADAGDAAPGSLAEVAFVGHVLPLALEHAPARHDPALVAARETALAQKRARLDTPVLDAFERALDAIPGPRRAALRLEPDESFRWSLLSSEMGIAQTVLRRALLEGLSREVAFFGDYGGAMPGGRVTLRPERFGFGAELARAYAATRIVVDLVNPGFVHGYGSKVVNCFAAGGFLLMDRKADFVARFGELGEAVSFASADELEAKLEHYLRDERARREVGAALGARARAEHGLAATFRRLVHRALALR